MQEEQPFAPLSSLIYEYYKDAITKFYILPDTKLKESRIAQDLDISRSPVDKAMDMLSEEGLVVKDHHKAPRVVSADLHDCVDVCQARMSIEGEAAYLAAKQISKEQLDELGDKVEGKYAELKEKAESGELKEKAQAAFANAKEKGAELFDKAKEKGAELAEKAKEKLQEKKEA